MDKDEIKKVLDSEFNCESECCPGNCNDEVDEDDEAILEFVEELAEEYFDKLEESDLSTTCPCCLLKDFLIRAYFVGHEDGRKSLAMGLGELLGEIAEE